MSNQRFYAALELAIVAHAGQIRKFTNEPYIRHPVRVAALAAVATEQDVLDLVRCGVRYDEDTDSLAKFV